MRSNQLDHTAVICPSKCVLFNSPETGILASEFQHVVWLVLTLINVTPTTTDKMQQQTLPRRRGNKRAQTTCLLQFPYLIPFFPFYSIFLISTGGIPFSIFIFSIRTFRDTCLSFASCTALCI